MPVLVYGHRGARGEAPENTLAGFAYAQQVGVQAVELDVRLSADEQLVVIHDATVDRTTNASGAVAALTAAELSRLDARKTHPAWPEPVGVPTLATVLGCFATIPHWAIEVKHDTPERLERVCRCLVTAIGRYGLAANTTVTSFDPVALEHMRRIAPDLPRAYIGAFDQPHFLQIALDLGCRQIDVPIATGSAAVVRAAQEHGMRVTGWPGNSVETLRLLVEWGVDQVTTDYPSMALAWFQQEGIAGSWERSPGAGGKDR
jgi:glycerophosphoryl diester phosphodiesterase